MDHHIRPFLLAAGTLLCSAALAAALSAGAADAPGAGSHGPLFGFTADESRTQESVEQRFDGDLNPADLSTWMKSMSSEANNVGSPHDKANAEFVRDQLEKWGWDAQIEIFYPLYPTLKRHTLELVAPTKFVAALAALTAYCDRLDRAAAVLGRGS